MPTRLRQLHQDLHRQEGEGEHRVHHVVLVDHLERRQQVSPRVRFEHVEAPEGHRRLPALRGSDGRDAVRVLQPRRHIPLQRLPVRLHILRWLLRPRRLSPAPGKREQWHLSIGFAVCTIILHYQVSTQTTMRLIKKTLLTLNSTNSSALSHLSHANSAI